jgi:hypothetical protein
MWNKINGWTIIFFLLLSFNGYSQSPLCASYPTTFCCEYVASITINGQTYAGNTGYSGPGYYDYTNTPVPIINAGQNINISYTAQTNGNYMEYFKLWIDFNGNGVLTDAGELVHSYNVSWLGTKVVNATFQVPTTVFNGPVYMRFVMVYANIPNLCGTYAYGNTFDFKTGITGAVDPFNHSISIFNSEGSRVPNIPIKLYKKLNSDVSYTLHSTYTTTSNALNITTTLDDGLYDFQIVIEAFTISNPTVSDAIHFNQKVINQNFNGKDYYRMDVNGNGLLTITDVYLIYSKILGIPWKPGIPNYRLFTQSEWNTISTSTTNLTSSISGVQNLTLTNPPVSGTTNLYLIRTGYAN